MLKLDNVKFINKGSIHAAFSIVIDAWGLTLHDCTAMESGDRKWVNFPSRKYEDKEGETKYFPFVFLEKERKARLDKAVFEELAKLEKEPSVFDAIPEDEIPF